MLINSLYTLSINNLLSIKPPISFSSSRSILPSSTHGGTGPYYNTRRKKGQVVRGGGRILCDLLPVDPWASAIDPQTLTNLLFALSLFPYLGFLYFITRVDSAPKLTLFGFHFLLVFVGATIPVGIYERVQYFLSSCIRGFSYWVALSHPLDLFQGRGVDILTPHTPCIREKWIDVVVVTERVQYGASLSNVDWLHGGAESLLALSNLFVFLGLREALRNSKE